MIELKTNLNKLQPATINFIAGSLKNGQVVVLPTDTIYGLSCRADDQEAVKKIYRLKKRNPKYPVLLLVSDLKSLQKYVRVAPWQIKELKKIWAKGEAPATVILENRSRFPKELISSSQGLALRLPKSVFLIKILKKLPCPLVSTSVNLSGEPALNSPRAIKSYFATKKLKPGLLVAAGTSPRRKPSQLIDLRLKEQVIVLRK